MKVGYFVFSHKIALGGHFRSLKILHNGWSEFENVDSYIINVGLSPSPVLKDLKNYYFFKSNLLYFIPNFFRILFLLKKENFNVLHSYDSTAYFLVRIYSYIFKIESYYTKCGGTNKTYTPLAINTLLFSEENYNYLNNREPDLNYYVIPNRVLLVEQDHQMIESIKKEFNLVNKKIVLRIGNINEYYSKTIESAFRLTEYYQNHYDVNVVLVFIGIDLDNTLDLFRSNYKHVNSLLLSDNIYTLESAKFIDLCDFNVATGRGAMESIGIGKPTYIYNADNYLPIKVDVQNFKSFLRYNFSERSKGLERDDLNYFTKPHPKLSGLFSEYLYYKRGNSKVLDIYKQSDNIKRKRYIDDFVKNLFKYIGVNIIGLDIIKDKLRGFING